MAPSNSAIVSVARDGAAERLERAGIVAAVRGGRLRASGHMYNTEQDVDAALEALAG
jgi:selenocysteine lyase/cysteine desulfurase